MHQSEISHKSQRRSKLKTPKHTYKHARPSMPSRHAHTHTHNQHATQHTTHTHTLCAHTHMSAEHSAINLPNSHTSKVEESQRHPGASCIIPLRGLPWGAATAVEILEPGWVNPPRNSNRLSAGGGLTPPPVAAAEPLATGVRC